MNTANLKALVQKWREEAPPQFGDTDAGAVVALLHCADDLENAIREIERMESERQVKARTAETPETGALKAPDRCSECGKYTHEGQDDEPVLELDYELAIKWRDDMRELQEHCRSMSERSREMRRIMDAKVVAFGCKEEARGGRCCSEWCLGDDCPVTFASTPEPKP